MSEVMKLPDRSQEVSVDIKMMHDKDDVFVQQIKQLLLPNNKFDFASRSNIASEKGDKKEKQRKERDEQRKSRGEPQVNEVKRLDRSQEVSVVIKMIHDKDDVFVQQVKQLLREDSSDSADESVDLFQNVNNKPSRKPQEVGYC